MPIKRLDKARESLPSGYQFGDAASDRDGMREEWERRYLGPVREMFSDPERYAAYRQRVAEANEQRPLLSQIFPQMLPVWLNPYRGETR